MMKFVLKVCIAKLDNNPKYLCPRINYSSQTLLTFFGVPLYWPLKSCDYIFRKVPRNTCSELIEYKPNRMNTSARKAFKDIRTYWFDILLTLWTNLTEKTSFKLQ